MSQSEAPPDQAWLDRELFKVAGQGSVQDAERLIVLGVDGRSCDLNGKTALMRAAARGDPEMAAILIPISDARQADQFGLDALMVAANAGKAECVELLLACADPLRRANQGETALMFAAASGHAKCVELLAPLADAKAVDSAGFSALVHAAVAKSPDCVAHLLPSSDIAKRCRNGMTPLMWAARAGDLLCVQAIADPTARAGLLHAIVRRGQGAAEHAHGAFRSEAANFLEALSTRGSIAAEIPAPEKRGRSSSL